MWRALWGFEDRELWVSSAQKEDRASFCRIGRWKGVSLAAGGIRFWMTTAIVRGAQSIIEQSPSALASGQWREQAAVRHDGRGDLDHDVSILIWLSEESRAPARSKVSMTIIRMSYMTAIENQATHDQIEPGKRSA
jgi:hypothetical protein